MDRHSFLQGNCVLRITSNELKRTNSCLSVPRGREVSSIEQVFIKRSLIRNSARGTDADLDQASI